MCQTDGWFWDSGTEAVHKHIHPLSGSDVSKENNGLWSGLRFGPGEGLRAACSLSVVYVYKKHNHKKHFELSPRQWKTMYVYKMHNHKKHFELTPRQDSGSAPRVVIRRLVLGPVYGRLWLNY